MGGVRGWILAKYFSFPVFHPKFSFGFDFSSYSFQHDYCSIVEAWLLVLPVIIFNSLVWLLHESIL